MSTSDVMIHIHPELSADERAKVENEVKKCLGVAAACFDQHEHPHALTVVYDPDAINSKQLLAAVQKFDAEASLVGM